MTNCSKCGARIKTHLWIVRGSAYCGASCERGGKSQFEKTHKALAKMRKDIDMTKESTMQTSK